MAVPTDKRASELTAPVSIADTDVFPGYRPGTGGEPNLDIRASAGLIRGVVDNAVMPGSKARIDKLTDEANLKDFYIQADGSNWAPAFQRAYNAIYDNGGARLNIKHGSYLLDRYLLSAVDNRILWNEGLTSVSGYAHHTQLPGNITLHGMGKPTLLLPRNWSSAGGNYTSDKPYGYGGSWQILTAAAGVGAEFTEYAVSAVVRDSTGHGVTLSSVSGLAVGDLVSVEGDQDNTPSAEDSPLQYLTIKSISSLTVYFAEKFLHYFEGVISTLSLKKCARDGGWVQNIAFENLVFKGTDASIESYVLISRTIGTRADNCEFKRVNFNFGRSQSVRLRGIDISDGGKLFIEATSKATLDGFDIDCSNLLQATTLGGLYVNDNAKQVVVQNGRIYGGARNGASLLWGVEAKLKNVVIDACAAGSSAVVTYADEDAALRLGHSMTAAVHSTRASAEHAKYKTKQTPNSKIVLENVEITGGTKRGIVGGNVELTLLGRTYINHAGSGAVPIEIGQTGTKTSDATYFPTGGVGSLKLLGDLVIDTDQAATLIPIKASYGGRGYLRAPDTTLTADVAAGATSVPVADGSRCSTALRIGPQIDHPTAFAPFTITISSISGNTLTTSALSTAAVSGSGLYFYEDEDLLSRCDLSAGRVFVNGVRSKMPRAGWLTKYPTTATGAGPYTGSFDISVPGEGEWQLDLIYLSQDKGHRVRARYVVNYSNEYAAFPANIISTALDSLTLRTACAFGTHTIAAGVVTVNLSNTTSGKSGVVYYRWTPLASMQVTLAVS